MAKFDGFYKIVQPKPEEVKIYDNQSLGGDMAYNNFSWYQRLLEGSGSRINRYREFDAMDADSEVARCLDTIAEEMTGNNPKTDLPLELKFQNEDANRIDNRTIITLKECLRYWCDIHDWSNRLFNIARVMIKYGDCFFVRNGENRKWEYVHSKNVLGAITSAEDITKIIGWCITSDRKRAKQISGQVGYNPNPDDETFYKAEDVIWFPLLDDMSDNAPFGQSVLRAVYRTFKQKELLEDSIIIYRLVRAPERRIFYINTGNMPPHRVKKHLETIKNEIRQKKIPSFQSGRNEIDSVYNPQCLSLDTEIPLLDGRTLPLSTLIEEFNNGKENWVYSCDPLTGKVVPGNITWAGITRKNAETIKLTFDNGETLICTPDHKIPVQGKGFVEAKDIELTDSLFAFNTREEKIASSKNTKYTQVFDNESKKWIFVHRLVHKFMKDKGIDNSCTLNEEFINSKKDTIHHLNFDRYDNNPNNLVFVNNKDHVLYHSKNGKTQYLLSKGIKSYRQMLEKNPELKKLHGKKHGDSLKKRFIEDPQLKKEFAQRLVSVAQPWDNQSVKFSDSMMKIMVDKFNANPKITRLNMMHDLLTDEYFMNIYIKLNSDKQNNICKIVPGIISDKAFQRFLNKYGFKNWRHFKQVQIQKQLKNNINTIQLKNIEYEKIALINKTINLVNKFSIFPYKISAELKKEENKDLANDFLTSYRHVICDRRNVINNGVFDKIAAHAGYESFNDFVINMAYFNHKVVKIEKYASMDVGTLTIDQDEKYHNYHTFAIKSGIFVKNSTSEDYFFSVGSDGKGSRVETLPGGQNLGELTDLKYFSKKLFRGLKIPSSYIEIDGDDASPLFNDGRVGTAYIQELRFSEYIERLQGYLEVVLDKEFKRFLRIKNVLINEALYRVVLPSPTNFGIYRKMQMDTELLSSFSNADGIPYLSKRFILGRFLHLTDDEIANNEEMLKQEKQDKSGFYGNNDISTDLDNNFPPEPVPDLGGPSAPKEPPESEKS